MRLVDRLRARAPWLWQPRVRAGLAIAAIAITLGWSRWAFDTLTRPEKPHIFPDSIVYLQTAQQPARIDHLFFPKPFTVPAIYRMVDGDAVRIVHLQRELAFASWWLLGLALTLALRRPRARALAMVATVALLLAPARLGFIGAILSESISDSLMALTLAAGVGLATAATRLAAGRRRTAICAALAATLVVLGAAWIFSRDSNAIAALVMVAVAVAAWRPLRAIGSRGWSFTAAAAIAVLSLVSIWSAGVTPSQPTGLLVNRDWQTPALPRRMLPLVNNLFQRVLPHPAAVDFFRDHGMPWTEDLPRHAGAWASNDQAAFLRDPASLPILHWLDEHGTTTWALWLADHPLDSADEVVDAQWLVLADRALADYMPEGWREAWRGHPVADPLRHATSHPLLLLLLLLGAPLMVRGARGPLRGVAGCMIAGGLIAIPAAFFGDAMEIERHCYGAGQQLVIGLIVLALARVDREPAPRVAS